MGAVAVGSSVGAGAGAVGKGPAGPAPFTAQFFGLDTNGVQGHVQRSHPEEFDNLHRSVVAPCML